MSRARQIQQATRKGQKARVALAGPAGAGKTWTALLIATELAQGGKILVVDTERGSAGLYSDHFTFETIDWTPPYDPRELAEDMATLSKDYAVVIVDSLTHFWQGEGGTLDIVDAAGARSSGNRFAGWKTGTPAQNALVEALLSASSHVIVSMRSKTEYVQDKDKNGRTEIRKVGMQPIQREGIEFEFTVTADMDQEHRVLVTKTRCHPLADKNYQGFQAKDMAQTLLEWLEAAVPDHPEQRHPITEEQRDELVARLNALPEEARNKAKTDFKDRFGLPTNLVASRYDEAETFVTEAERAALPGPKLDFDALVGKGEIKAPDKADADGEAVAT